MTDPTFADLRLLTKGPASESRLESDHLMPPPNLALSAPSCVERDSTRLTSWTGDAGAPKVSLAG